VSIESLLDMLAVPSVLSKENTGEPLEASPAMVSSLGSPDSLDKASILDDALVAVCSDLPITPDEVRDNLTLEDSDDWHQGNISIDALSAFAHCLVQRREMDQGKVPTHFTEHATCKQCGPVWLWFTGEVCGCQWCWNRMADRPIPRPDCVRCSECKHFNRIDHPHLGHCAKGEPEPIAGLWDTTQRNCLHWLSSDHKQEELTHG